MPQGWTECSTDGDTVWRAVCLIQYDNTWSRLWYYTLKPEDTYIVSSSLYLSITDDAIIGERLMNGA